MKILTLLLFNIFLLNAYLIHLDDKCYQLYFDTDKKTPVLAYYKLTKEEVEKKNPKRITYFKIDKRLPKEYRVKSADYKHTNFDRGHQVGNNIVDYDVECQHYSFLMSNITPQTRHFNRSVYKKIENFELDLAKKEGQIFVIEGNFGSNGKINNINIPKYFFKIFLTNNKNYCIIVDQKGNKYNFKIIKKYPIYKELVYIFGEEFFYKLKGN